MIELNRSQNWKHLRGRDPGRGWNDIMSSFFAGKDDLWLYPRLNGTNGTNGTHDRGKCSIVPFVPFMREYNAEFIPVDSSG